MLEAITMLPSLFVALHYGDGDAHAFLKTIGILAICGFALWFFAKPNNRNLRAREGLVSVALSWIFLSIFGALPFMFSGLLPNFFDALFEAVSGFTTTGATVMRVFAFENAPHGIMFWRSFTQWIGGMGVLVLTLALLPQMTGRPSHLIRAESPGPSLSKLVPKIGDMAKILYLMYGVLTLLETIILIVAGLSPYDALIHAFSTAGTGGFSNYHASVEHFNSAWVDGIIAFFMVLFGINFALFYRILRGAWRDALKSEELHWYLGIVVSAALMITLLILPQYGTFGKALRYGSFQVASIISTTGYVTQNFNLWPQAAKIIILALMLIGSCAGSTAGGLKVVRVAILAKTGQRELRHAFQPRKIQVVRFEGKAVDDALLSKLLVFFFLYMAAILIGAFLISLENKFDFETNLTAAISSVSNIGPGFGMVGPIENFSAFGWTSKLTLSFLMLAGRLELFPLLAVLHPSIWKKQ